MSVTLDPLYARQLELELEMVSVGIDHYRSNINRNIETERGADTKSGRFLVGQMINPIAEGITAFVSDAYSGKPGPRADAAVILKDLDPHQVAFVATRRIISKLMLQARVSMLVTAVKAQAPGLVNTVMKTEDEAGSTPSHRELVLKFAMAKHEVQWDRWDEGTLMRLGLKLLEIIHEQTGIIRYEEEVISSSGSKYKTQYVVEFTEEAYGWLQQSMLKGEVTAPIYMPMVHPPRDWTGLSGGGFLSNALPPLPLVRSSRKGQHELLEKAHLGAVYAGLNAIQKTKWQVNEEVLTVAQILAETSSGMAGLIPSGDLKMPVKPFDIDTNPDALKQWKRQAREIHKSNRKLRGKRLLQQVSLDEADRFRAEKALYFPHNLDFRGRAYPVAGSLHPQGNDLVKGLLRFAIGKPVTTEAGRSWLAVHGANCFGIDKVPFEQRIQWVQDHERQIELVATDPLEYLWWTEADSPWCFLAWCFEWHRMRTEGSAFRNHIPVALDGSCNGLQHYSAMLLDEVGGAAVNLIDLGAPQDIYQRVADEVIRKLKIAADQEGDEDVEKHARWAHAWLNFGIDRKVTKRPVMVLPYGGTGRSCMNYVEEAITEKINDGKEHNLGEELFPAIGYLASVVWSSIGDVVIAARGAMDWLQSTSRLVSKENKPIHWTTPSGFVAYQRIMNSTYRRIKTHINGKIVRPAVKEETDKIHKTKQATSISPNFVHSMDASAMILTVDRASALGIDSFAMIHDSFGTHAEDIAILAQILREVFVEMYEAKPLEHFRDEIMQQLSQSEPDPLPPEGRLNLRGVLHSPYFFA